MDTITLNRAEFVPRTDREVGMGYLKDFKPRMYQESIFNTCTKKNTMVVLPTGIGKTAIFLMMAAYRLTLYPKSKIVLLGPTRPLIEQYAEVFEKHFTLPKEKMVIFTGMISPEKRIELWKDAQIIFSTPQGMENDVLSNRISLADISLLGFDEAHRATGEYSYNFIAMQYLKKAIHPRILALTASPGNDHETIQGVIKNLGIESVEIRTVTDPDVAPYVQDVEIQRIFVELPDEFLQIKKQLEECYLGKIRELKTIGFATDSKYTKKNLLGMQAAIHQKIAQGEKDFEMLKAISLIAEAIKVQHAIELIETQGLESLKEFFNKLQGEAALGKTKASINLVKDIHFRTAVAKTDRINGIFEHPKRTAVKELIAKELASPIDSEIESAYPELFDETTNKHKKIILFSQYRDAGSLITKELNALGYKAKLFVGQAKKKDTGLSQKKQKAMLDAFANNEFNILVSSSVGEEGLDIPQVDLVIFYEPVPSAIRKIQRSGRTGRLEKGKVVMFITKDTIDEVYYHISRNSEKRMQKVVSSYKQSNAEELKKQEKLVQTVVASQNTNIDTTIVRQTLMDFEHQEKTNPKTTEKQPVDQTPQIKIIADYREKGSAVLKALIDNCELNLEQLHIGDFVLSSRTVVEYKTVPDFVDSILDGRLLAQLKELRKFERPLIIIEGMEDMYSVRRVHPNAIRGMMATIAISYGIPIIQTKTSKETAEFLLTIAKREQIDEKNVIQHHFNKPNDIKEQQAYFISALPNIGTNSARPLLQHFKSVKNIVNASEKELREVDLIGPKKAKAMKELFDKEWEE